MSATPSPPSHVRWVTRTLEEAGFETWAVGGAIRNTLLGVGAGDWDLATRAPPPVVRRLFPRTIPVGIEHGTVGVLTREGTLVEVTTFRRDVETFGRKAVVEFAETLLEDLSRRDFTVNAIAWHPLRDEFLDPFQGRGDLEEGILRTVGTPRERFSEDYLRVLRGLRFSSRFRLRIEEETWAGLCAATGELGVLSPERIREELMKVLSQDQRPSGALALYHLSGALKALYPELATLEGVPRPDGSGEDLLSHTLLLVDALSPRHPLDRLAALLHGLGVPEGDPPGEAGAGSRSRERAAALLIRFRYSNAEIRGVGERVQMGPEPPVHLSTPAELRRWLHRAGPDQLGGLARLWVAKARVDGLRRGAAPDRLLRLISGLRGEARSGVPLRTEELAVNGRDLIALGLRPGPRFGEILEGLMEEVLDDPALNEKETLRELVSRRERLGEGGTP